MARHQHAIRHPASGRQWTRAEIQEKYYELCPDRIELIEGKLFWTDEQRLNMLGLLLENVGMDAAVRLGDPALWKQAIDERLKAPEESRPKGVEDVGRKALEGRIHRKPT